MFFRTKLLTIKVLYSILTNNIPSKEQFCAVNLRHVLSHYRRPTLIYQYMWVLFSIYCLCNISNYYAGTGNKILLEVNKLKKYRADCPGLLSSFSFVVIFFSTAVDFTLLQHLYLKPLFYSILFYFLYIYFTLPLLLLAPNKTIWTPLLFCNQCFNQVIIVLS